MERKAKNIYWFSWRWITVGQTHQYWSGLIVTRCSIPLSSLHLSSHCFFINLLYFFVFVFYFVASLSSLHLSSHYFLLIILYLYFISLYSFSSLHLSSHYFSLIIFYLLFLILLHLYLQHFLIRIAYFFSLCLLLECWSIGLTSKDLVLYTFFISLCLVLGICCMHIFSSIFGDNLVFSLLQGSTFRLIFSNLELTRENVR